MIIFHLLYLICSNPDFENIYVKDVPKRTRPPRTPTPTFNQTNARISGYVIIPVIIIVSIAMCIYFFWELKHPKTYENELESPLLDNGSSVPVSSVTANHSQIIPNSVTLGIHKESKVHIEPFKEAEEDAYNQNKKSSRHMHGSGRRSSRHGENEEKKHSSRNHKGTHDHEITHHKSRHKIEPDDIRTRTMPVSAFEAEPGPSPLAPPPAQLNDNKPKSARVPKKVEDEYSYSDYYYSDYDYYSGYYSDYTDGSDATMPKQADESDDSSSSSSMISLAKITMPFL